MVGGGRWAMGGAGSEGGWSGVGGELKHCHLYQKARRIAVGLSGVIMVIMSEGLAIRR